MTTRSGGGVRVHREHTLDMAVRVAASGDLKMIDLFVEALNWPLSAVGQASLNRIRSVRQVEST